ncbi:tetratricopeptide repeat protein [Opitutus sp. ER46]|uniref:tetratricopeptide repeat protein n=1 Tax=Opitutus sp. ER46 TaxID=2161864 RepID=UPI000D40D8D1|nr:tetratricopeptide repeat protein [Opitutus sp. ER46]PTX92467.1 hypothetical protein DB354_14120 [Opitutus sp. ER46]
MIVALVFLAWANSLSGPFVLDDQSSIVDNPTIRDFGSFRWISPPAGRGETVGGRPVLNLSFALNHATGGLDVRVYHATNLAIHALAALALFGLLRRALALPGLSSCGRSRTLFLPAVLAALWAVHPLNTQAVTYVVQRAESLMGLFYLTTLYAFARSLEGPHRRVWQTVAIAACWLGMGTKENMVSAPIVVLLFDRAFGAGSFAGAWRARRGLYLGLATAWVFLAVLLASTGGNRGGTSGFDVGVSWIGYVLTQAPALVRYALLAIWPHPLVFEYGDFSVASAIDVAWPLLLVTGALGATLYALWRHPAVGAIATLAWAVLAPTSLVPGTLQMIVEHRMYLPLAAVMVLAGLGLEALTGSRGQRILAFGGAGLVLAFTLLTHARNQAYRSELALWQDTVAKRPLNPRAHNNLGRAQLLAGRSDEAVASFKEAIRLQPNHAYAQANLGACYRLQRRWPEAAEHFERALAADPALPDVRVNLAVALTQLGRIDAAVSQYRAELATHPDDIEAKTNLAALLIDQGLHAEAARLLREALAASPDLAEAHLHLGRIEELQRQTSVAEAEFRAALRLKPTLAAAHLALGNLLLGRGDASGAEDSYREALRHDATLASAHYGLGNIRARQQQFEPAMQEFLECLRLDPGHVAARNNLANCQLVTGRLADAIANYEKVLQARPGDTSVRRNLDLARELARQRGGVGR